MRFTRILLKNIQINYYKPLLLKQKKEFNSIDFLHSYGKFTIKYPNASKNDRQKAIKRFLDKTRE